MKKLNMIATSVVLFAIIAMLSVTSCEKREANKDNVAEISLKLSDFDFLKKAMDDNPDDYPQCQEGVDPYCVWVFIGDGADSHWYKVEMWDDDETDVIRWVLGQNINEVNLTLEQFFVYAENSPACDATTESEFIGLSDADKKIGLLKLAPAHDSKFVENNPNDITGLPMNFKVKAFEKHPVPVDVMCYDPKIDYKNYGWNWFIIEDNRIEELCFFGNIHCVDFENWEGVGDYPATLEGYAFGAVFKVQAFADEVMTDMLYEYDNTANNGVGEPLCFPFVNTPEDDEYWIRFMLQAPDQDGNPVWVNVYEGQVYEDGGYFTMDDNIFFDDNASDTGVRHFTLICDDNTTSLCIGGTAYAYFGEGAMVPNGTSCGAGVPVGMVLPANDPIVGNAAFCSQNRWAWRGEISDLDDIQLSDVTYPLLVGAGQTCISKGIVAGYVTYSLIYADADTDGDGNLDTSVPLVTVNYIANAGFKFGAVHTHFSDTNPADQCNPSNYTYNSDNTVGIFNGDKTEYSVSFDATNLSGANPIYIYSHAEVECEITGN